MNLMTPQLDIIVCKNVHFVGVHKKNSDITAYIDDFAGICIYRNASISSYIDLDTA